MVRLEALEVKSWGTERGNNVVFHWHYISQLHIAILDYLLTNYYLNNIFAKCFIQIIAPNYEPFTSLHLKYIILELQQSA